MTCAPDPCTHANQECANSATARERQHSMMRWSDAEALSNHDASLHKHTSHMHMYTHALPHHASTPSHAPGGQSMTAVSPTRGQYVPAWLHTRHTEAPTDGANVATAHPGALDSPATLHAAPAEHGAGLLMPVVLQNVPTGHTRGVLAPVVAT